jgi:hypothetical protein
VQPISRVILTVLSLVTLVAASGAAASTAEKYSFVVDSSTVQLGAALPESLLRSAVPQREYYDPAQLMDVVELSVGQNTVVLESNTRTIVRIEVTQPDWMLSFGVRVGDTVDAVREKIPDAIVGQRRVIFSFPRIAYKVIAGWTYSYQLELAVADGIVRSIQVSLERVVE